MSVAERGERPISVSFHGLGGQGGGVLMDWLVDLAEASGYLAQATSVPGVAQRTGATVYYLEMFSRGSARKAGTEPVMALMPMPGDVDVVLASELVEAGRAVNLGVVTPDRTTLITSTHRVYTISEKVAMGNAIADSERVLDECRRASRHLVGFDMQAAAERTGSVISAVLFGAIAGARVLPMERAAFEQAIRRGGVGVDASLAAFAAGYEAAKSSRDSQRRDGTVPSSAWPAQGDIPSQIAATFPLQLREIVLNGARRCADYQDAAYARTYLQRLLPVLALEAEHGDYRLTRETARYLALWMSFEDTIRVADLKIRAERFERFRNEVRASPGQIVYVAEFLHPRFQEICDTLPAALGRYLHDSRFWRWLLSPLFRSGRHIHTAKLGGFGVMFLLSRLKRWRRGSLRFSVEDAAISQWLADVARLGAGGYELAFELAQCPRLIKGYSDTHERGRRNFERIMSVLQRVEAMPDAPIVLARLRDAALRDEHGRALDAEMARVA